MSDIDQRQALLPPHLRIDSQTEYVYHHFSTLLSADELAAWRYREYELYSSAKGEVERNRWTTFFKIAEMERQFPELLARIRLNGVAPVIAAAAARVIRDGGDRITMNRCARCGTICRGPAAKQCFECGHDWHDEKPHD